MKKFDVNWSFASLIQLIAGYEFTSVLDVGSGDGQHSSIFRAAGKNVTSIDKFNPNADTNIDFLDIVDDKKYDVVFCSHVVEHQRNIGIFLDAIYKILSDNGILCIIGPNHDPNKLIEGHLTTWALPFAIQQLVLAGFDLSDANIFSLYDWETSIICKKNKKFSRNIYNQVGYEFVERKSWPFSPQQGLNILNDQKLFFMNNNYLSGVRIKGGKDLTPKLINRNIAGNFRAKFQIFSSRFNSDIIEFN